jgi:hypothetical protein
MRATTFALFVVLALPACTKKPVPVELPILEKQQEAATKRLGEMDAEIKTVQDDPIAAAALTEEKELLKSRMERLKENLTKFQPAAPAGEAAPAGHH